MRRALDPPISIGNDKGIFIRSRIRVKFVLVLIMFALLCSQAFGQTTASKRIISGQTYDYDSKAPISNASLELSGQSIDKCPDYFCDGFNQENSTLWRKSNWANNDPLYLNTWKSDFNHIRIDDGNLLLNLDNQPCINNKSQCQNKSFASGEYSTACDQYRYGDLSARIQAGKGNGIITALFLMSPEVAFRDEIDVEIFGHDPVSNRWEMNTDYYVNGGHGNGASEPWHSATVLLSFDPTMAYHNYNITWIGNGDTYGEIKWYVDSKLRRDVWLDKNGYVQSNAFDESGNIIATGNGYKGSLPAKGSRIILNLWAAKNWSEARFFDHSSERLIQAKIDWIRYSHPIIAKK
jgi:hypothetical protein